MKIRILIVDDEIEIRQMLDRHFRYIGYEVDTAENGLEAVEKLSNNYFHIVISDIMMPVMDGVDLLRTIRAQYPMIHTIMITGFVTLENALSCMRHGADTCIFKPLEDLTELEQAVSNAVKALTTWKQKLEKLNANKTAVMG